MEKISVMERIAKNIAFIICICIFFAVSVWGIFRQSNYSFGDYPYFAWNSLFNYLAVIINIVVFFCVYFLFRNKNISVLPCLVLYGLVCLSFILVVPLEPFSDMQSIFEIAGNGLSDDAGYLGRYKNQIPVTLYLYVLRIFGDGMIVPKIMNIVCNVIIVYMTCKIYTLLFGEDKRILLYACMFVPAILYTNHIYNDTISTALTIVMAYLALSRKKSRVGIILLIVFSAISVWLRASNILFVAAIHIYMLFSLRRPKLTFVYFITFSLLFGCLSFGGKNLFDKKDGESYPIWSFIQMGFNEEEFGFQDGSHSVEWTFSDCVDRVKDLGAWRTCKLLAKKELWMWTEGTYQAERYGFGDAGARYSKCNTVTQNIRKMDESFLRKAAVYFMKGQYYVFAILALAGIAAGKDRQGTELLLYFICGFFFFYLIWEMKSRYIYALYPYIIIFAVNGADRLHTVFRDRRSRHDVVRRQPDRIM